MDMTQTETAVARELARHFVDTKNSTLLVTACRCGHWVGLDEGWSEHIAVAVTAVATAAEPLAAAA